MTEPKSARERFEAWLTHCDHDVRDADTTEQMFRCWQAAERDAIERVVAWHNQQTERWRAQQRDYEALGEEENAIALDDVIDHHIGSGRAIRSFLTS